MKIDLKKAGVILAVIIPVSGLLIATGKILAKIGEVSSLKSELKETQRTIDAQFKTLDKTISGLHDSVQRLLIIEEMRSRVAMGTTHGRDGDGIVESLPPASAKTAADARAQIRNALKMINQQQMVFRNRPPLMSLQDPSVASNPSR